MAVELGDRPPEIVAGILDASHPSSLLAVAQTSKHHYAISIRFLFRTVKMTLDVAEEPEELRRNVKQWEAMLFRSDAFAYVRRLIFYSTDLGRDTPANPYLKLEPPERDDHPAHSWICWDTYQNCWYPPYPPLDRPR